MPKTGTRLPGHFPMDPLPKSSRSTFKELRIVVLHNQDFSSSDIDTSSFAARADILNAAQDVARALAAKGHFVDIQGIDAPHLPELIQRFTLDPPDLVFNLCESLQSDDRHEIVIPALLDLLKIPYTGSGPLALGISLHKDKTQRTLKSAGIPVPAYVVLSEDLTFPTEDIKLVHKHKLQYPLIVKPTRENASVGIDEFSVVTNDQDLLSQLERLRSEYKQPLLVEEYIDGKEFNVSLLGNSPVQVFPLHEIDFTDLPSYHPRIVSYIGKWDKQSPIYLATMPKLSSDLEPQLMHQIMAVAKQAFHCLELQDYARCDIRLSQKGEPYVIDMNPNNDLSKNAGFAIAAKEAGYSYEDLIERIAFFALSRSPYAQHSHSPLYTESVLADQTRRTSGSAQDQAFVIEELAVQHGRDGVRLRTSS